MVVAAWRVKERVNHQRRQRLGLFSMSFFMCRRVQTLDCRSSGTLGQAAVWSRNAEAKNKHKDCAGGEEWPVAGKVLLQVPLCDGTTTGFGASASADGAHVLADETGSLAETDRRFYIDRPVNRRRVKRVPRVGQRVPAWPARVSATGGGVKLLRNSGWPSGTCIAMVGAHSLSRLKVLSMNRSLERPTEDMFAHVNNQVSESNSNQVFPPHSNLSVAYKLPILIAIMIYSLIIIAWLPHLCPCHLGAIHRYIITCFSLANLIKFFIAPFSNYKCTAVKNALTAAEYW